jgi:hypothetical protein
MIPRCVNIFFNVPRQHLNESARGRESDEEFFNQANTIRTFCVGPIEAIDETPVVDIELVLRSQARELSVQVAQKSSTRFALLEYEHGWPAPAIGIQIAFL